MILILVFIWWLFFLPSPAHATILINEVHPSPDQGNEWVELYNSGDQTVALNQWSLEDQLSTPSVIYSFDLVEISAGGLLTIDLPSAKLNNSADGVVLKNAPGEIQDSMSYQSSQTNKSWARLPDGTGSFYLTNASKNAINGSVTPTPSPTPTLAPSPSPSPLPSAFPSPTPISYPDLSVTEIMACPASGDTEWLELYNATTTPVEIETWLVRDMSGTSKTVSSIIPAEAYGIVSWAGSLLNNTGDLFTLLTDQQVVVDSGSISACTSGQSFVKQDGIWKPTLAVTKGARNPDLPVTTPPASPTTSPLTETSPSTEIHTELETPYPTARLPTRSSPASLSATLSKLHLDTPAHHPMASPSATISLVRPQASKWGIVNVILGGALLLATGSYLIHENYFPLT